MAGGEPSLNLVLLYIDQGLESDSHKVQSGADGGMHGDSDLGSIKDNKCHRQYLYHMFISFAITRWTERVNSESM